MANIRWGGQRLQRDTTLIGAPAPAQFYLGANVMDSNGYYSVEQPFLDILKQAGSNYGYTPWWTRNAGGTDTLEEAPFSLLCDDFNYPTTLNLGMPPIKWSPGLWGLTYQNPWTATSYQSDLAGLASAGSAWKGYMVYATWNLFENATLGTYNWTLMDNTIAACAAQNLQFMIQLNLGTFNKSASQANLPQGTGSDLLPEYILKGSTYGAANMGSSGFTPVSPALYGYYVGPLTGGPGCYWANFTNANVMARIQALANAMGARYNSNPNFYGVILCAWDTQSPNPGTGITDAQYFGTQSTPAVQGRELILSYFKTAMPNCNVCEMTGYEGPGQSPTTPQNHAQWCVQNAFPLSCSDTAPATGWNANYESIAGFTANGNSFSSIGGGGTTGTLNGTTWTTPSGSYLLEFISTSQIVTATLVDGGSTCTFSPAVTGSPNLANTQVKMAIMPTRLNVGMYSWFGMPYPGSTWTPPSAGMRSYCSFFATVEGGDFSNAGGSPIWSSSTNAGAAADILNAGNQYYDASHVFMSILYNSDYTLPASNGATFTNIYSSLNAIGVSANAYPPVYPSGQEFTYVETWMNINIIADTPVPGAAGTYPAAYSPITYGLTFSGACTLNLFGASSLASASPNISIAGTQITSTMTAGQSALVTFTMSTTGGLRLQVLNLPSNSNYFRNASIVDQAYAANYASGSILHPLFKSSLTGAGLGFGLERLRFMGGLNTNFEDYNLTFSATLASGATSGTLTNVNNGTSTTAWPLPTGTYQVVFATGQSIPVSFTYNATACSWATPLSGSITTSAPGCMACASGYIWNTRPLPGSVGYNTLPLEVVIQSCNEISSDCWLNIPATAAVADAALLSNLASLCYNGSGANTSSWNVSAFAGLAVNQKLYLEYSNETAGAWNGGAGYAQGANFLVMMSNAVTPNLYTANGSSRGYGSAEWYGVEVATIAQQFSSTYGLAFTKRVVPTLMCQFALGNGIGFLEAGMNTTHWTYRAYTKGIAAIGWAPYCPLADSFTNMSDLGNLFGLSASAQLNEIFSLAYTNVGASGYTYAGFRTDGWIGDALGASNGCAGMIAGYAGQPWASLPIHCYELGIDMAIVSAIPVGYQPQVQQLLTNVARDARMSYVYSDLGHVLSPTQTGYLPGLNALSITGNHLDWVHPATQAINSGGWGIFELITQMASVPPTSTVPRYQGVMNYILHTSSSLSVPNNYNAITNTNVYTDGVLPSLGSAGSTYVDPTFGTTILRVTDSNTTAAFSRTGQSFFPTDGSAEIRRCNVGCSRFIAHCQGGEDLIFDFNSSAFTTTLHPVGGSYSPNLGLGLGSVCFDAVSPDVIYGVDGSNNISSYNLATLVSTSGVWKSGSIAGASGFGDFTLALANGLMLLTLGPQDTATLVGVYQPSTSTQLVLNTTTGAINGGTPVQIYINGTAQAWVSFSVHNTTIGQEGRYVKITPSGTNVGTYTGYVVWDTQSGTVSLVQNVQGHQAVGYGYFTSGYGSGYQVQMCNITTQAGINGPRTILNTYPFSPTDESDQYQSWENSQSSFLAPLGWTHTEAPSVGPYPYAPTITVPYQREVCAIATNGSGTVWRFAHTFMYYNGNFQEENFDHMFVNGLYMLFHSNMQNTLGTSSSDGSPRTDLFLAKLVGA